MVSAHTPDLQRPVRGPGGDTDLIGKGDLEVNKPKSLSSYRGLNCVTQRARSSSLVPVNVTLLRNKLFADVTKMRSQWISVGPQSSVWCPYKKKRRDTDTE